MYRNFVSAASKSFIIPFFRMCLHMFASFQILVDFRQILVKISGNCDPLRGQLLIFSILGPLETKVMNL